MWKSCGRTVQKLLGSCARKFFFGAIVRNHAPPRDVHGAFASRFA
jgi:hypothetical protein